MPLPLFVRKMLLPTEATLVLSAFVEEAKRAGEGGEAASLERSIGADLLRDQVTANILRWANDIKGDIHNGKPPRAVALWLMMNVAREYVVSGRFHVYRGFLSMQGQGLNAINRYCCDELEKLGQMTSSEKRETLAATAGEIREVG